MKPPVRESDDLSLRRQTILVVDDDSGIRQMLSTLFQYEGFRVVTAVDGVEALRHLKSIRIDLVISDLQMPGMDGKALLSALRALPRKIPFLFMSGSNELSPQAAHSLGASGLVKKPFGVEEMKVEVLRVLEPAR